MRAFAAALNAGRFRVAGNAVLFCPFFALTLAHLALWAAAMRALAATLNAGRFVVVVLIPPRALIALSNLCNSLCNLLRSDFKVCNTSIIVLRTLNCTNRDNHVIS